MVVEAIRLVIGDDDCALIPELRIRRDRVDRAGRHRLADLAVGIAWVVVVARFGLVNGGNLIRPRVGVRDRRCQPLLVRVAAADVEHAAFGQRIVGYVGEEVTKPAQAGVAHLRRIGNIAKILRAVVMADIGIVRGDAVAVGRLEVVAFLIPAPVNRLAVQVLDIGDILLDVWQIEGRVLVAGQDRLNAAPLEGERQAGEGEVRGDVVVGIALLRASGLPVVRRCVVLGTVEGLRVIDQRRPLRRAGVTAHAVCLAVRAVLDPLRFTRLPGEHRHRIRGGGRVLGCEDVVEDREPVGPLPEERNGVTVDVRHHEACELRALGNVGCPTPRCEARVLVVGELVHLWLAVHDVDLGREPSVRVVDAINDAGVLIGPDPERLDRDGHAIGVRVGLGKAQCVPGGTRLLAVRVESVDPWERAILVVERVVLVEDHEDVFDPSL